MTVKYDCSAAVLVAVAVRGKAASLVMAGIAASSRYRAEIVWGVGAGSCVPFPVDGSQDPEFWRALAETRPEEGREVRS